jgi:hypothetical protein
MLSGLNPNRGNTDHYTILHNLFTEVHSGDTELVLVGNGFFQRHVK